MTGAVHCRRRKHRGLHPWVFSNEVVSVEGRPEPGDTVRVFDRREFLGSGMYNPHSLIAVRLYSDREREFDLDFIKERLRAAREYRGEVLSGEEDYRLCYGEGDGLPGLVVDKYGRHFVVQSHALAVERRLELVTRALLDSFEVESVYEKNDFRLRDPEGLPRREGPLHGVPGRQVPIAEAGARFQVDIALGQKTGWYFDQRVTRRRVREFARGRRFLDVFSYSGGFAVNAALGGAETVVAVDSSVTATGLGAANAAHNGVAECCEFRLEEAFRYLTGLARDRGGFDMVCLDPPAFIKAKREREGGLRGYRTINTLAMRLLPPGGILVTSSCSHHLFWQDFLDMLVGAARDAGREFTILERTSQGPDHPVLLSMPESEYLRCFILRVA
ncbi:MAG TPA: class I SAM-dependent rRNA methyltransferase [candidate division WOR-3 bacterium]|uniref:Class I SAM-dependent rRNA methyltransferase n=1 Tax=candidate division WOR-3 bacterium TaxID=2052148 RepID=A0A7V0T5F9_UNCW3|nr:class I SAM-dependent rRNA methyltransferase [candidate division WOR-3 bacterium]